MGPLVPLVSSQDKENLERVKTSHLGQVSHFAWAIHTLCDRVVYGQHAKYKSPSPCLTIMACTLVCLCTCFCLHTRPGLTLLQFAPFGTTMRLECKDWRQTAALVCGIIQPLLPSPALCSHPCVWAPGHRIQSIQQQCKIQMLAAPAASSHPCALPKHANTSFFTCFNKTAQESCEPEKENWSSL